MPENSTQEDLTMVDDVRIPVRAPVAVSQSFEWADLPDALRTMLASIPRDQWKHVGVTICPSDLLSDAIALLALFARVWEKSRAAEDFRKDRLSGDERDRFRQEFIQATREIAGTTIRLGIRAKLFGELQSGKELLKRCDPETWDMTWTKAMSKAVGHGAPVEEEPPAQERKPAV